MKRMQNNFIFIANNLGLDFVNTIIMRDGAHYDTFKIPDDLAHWFAAAEINVAGEIDQIVFEKAILLRSSIKNCVKALSHGNELNHDDINVLNAALKHRQETQTLSLENQTLRFDTSQNAHTPLSALGQISFQTAKLLTSDNTSRIKPCSNPNCILTFNDTSKSGRRRWCSMEICGNRAKASKHYHSHKE